MKRVLFTIKNTYRAVKLLSDPHIAEILSKELYGTTGKSIVEHTFASPKVGKGSILPHRHYLVQILN